MTPPAVQFVINAHRSISQQDQEVRTNLPVTHVEYPLTEQTLIVSKTDLKGKLTYFNDQFVQVSGFTEQELMGQPHNIIRHPAGSLRQSLDNPQGGQALGRRSKEPPQEWRLLLGAGKCNADLRKRSSHRIHVDPHQASRRSARRGGTRLRADPRKQGSRVQTGIRHDPQALGVRFACPVYPNAQDAPGNASYWALRCSACCVADGALTASPGRFVRAATSRGRSLFSRGTCVLQLPKTPSVQGPRRLDELTCP